MRRPGVRPVSISRWPPGASQVARVRDDPAVDVEPVRAAVERDPRLVVAGLGGHGGDRVGRHVRRVGDQHVDPPAQGVRQRGVQVALEDPLGRQVAPGARHATGSTSAAYTSTSGSRASTAAPTAPDPQHRSTTTDRPIVRDVLVVIRPIGDANVADYRDQPAGRYGGAGRRRRG